MRHLLSCFSVRKVIPQFIMYRAPDQASKTLGAWPATWLANDAHAEYIAAATAVHVVRSYEPNILSQQACYSIKIDRPRKLQCSVYDLLPRAVLDDSCSRLLK